MAGSIRKFFESIAYMGLKPRSPGAPQQRGRLRQLRDWLVIGGPSPNDPLYLSNRTWAQRIRLWLVVATPVVIVLAVVGYAMLTPAPSGDKPPAQLSTAEIAARTAILPKDFKVVQNTDLQITEVTVEKNGGSTYLVGVLKNHTTRQFGSAEMTFDLTDDTGSQVGAASATAGVIAPQGTVRFRVPITQSRAAFVLVRDVRGAL